MNGAMKVIIGLLLILVGLYAYFSNWLNGFFGKQFMVMLKLIFGNIPGLVILIGLVVLLLGFSDLKSK
ncbi:hypothetical protein HYX18_02915 [Candidatus Woesearchaeota archaeon]|nr:hypothetical protein [Candidatus Woesearchaeota archaeon]